MPTGLGRAVVEHIYQLEPQRRGPGSPVDAFRGTSASGAVVPAAVDVDHLSGDVIRRRGGEEGRNPGDICRGACAAGGGSCPGRRPQRLRRGEVGLRSQTAGPLYRPIPNRRTCCRRSIPLLLKARGAWLVGELVGGRCPRTGRLIVSDGAVGALDRGGRGGVGRVVHDQGRLDVSLGGGVGVRDVGGEGDVVTGIQQRRPGAGVAVIEFELQLAGLDQDVLEDAGAVRDGGEAVAGREREGVDVDCARPFAESVQQSRGPSSASSAFAARSMVIACGRHSTSSTTSMLSTAATAPSVSRVGLPRPASSADNVARAIFDRWASSKPESPRRVRYRLTFRPTDSDKVFTSFSIFPGSSVVRVHEQPQTAP